MCVLDQFIMILKGTKSPILIVIVHHITPSITLGVGENLTYEQSMVIKAILTREADLQKEWRDEFPMVKVILLKVDRLEILHYGYHSTAKGVIRILTTSPEELLRCTRSTQAIIKGINVESQQPKGNKNITTCNKRLPK